MDVSSYALDGDSAQRIHSASRERKAAKRKLKTDLPIPHDGEPYIAKRIPMEWLRLSSQCGNRGLAVAILLWRTASWQKGSPYTIPRQELRSWGVDPRTERRCLERMEAVGLVSAEFARGKGPRVTLLDPKVTPTMLGS